MSPYLRWQTVQINQADHLINDVVMKHLLQPALITMAFDTNGYNDFSRMPLQEFISLFFNLCILNFATFSGAAACSLRQNSY